MMSNHGTLTDMKINNREVEIGTELSVKGKRGRYTFQGTKQTSAGRTVVSLVGPINSGHEAFHACYIEDVLRVHRIERKRPANA